MEIKEGRERRKNKKGIKGSKKGDRKMPSCIFSFSLLICPREIFYCTTFTNSNVLL